MNSSNNKYRFERKFLITSQALPQVEQHIKLHPVNFTEVFSQRRVNNIYFDTFDFRNYHDNIEGNSSRKKTRIRWYGCSFGHVAKAVLEHKVKTGWASQKLSYAVNPFTFDRQFCKRIISEAVDVATVPTDVAHELLSLQPVLFNHYNRRYFLSRCRTIRLTLDSQLTYYGLRYAGNTFLNKSVDRETVIIEFKYDQGFDEVARDSTSNLVFRLTKSSKFLQGLERTMF